jgi:sulfur-oxidizing protein SoxY
LDGGLVDRRQFLRVTTGAVAGTVLASQLTSALAQGGLEGEDIANLNKGLQQTIGRSITDLTAAKEVRLVVPSTAESGANVPLEIKVGLPAEQVKAIHCFSDQNPSPHLFSIIPSGVLPFYATRVRLAATSPVRAVVETADGRYLLASQSVRVAVGGC